MLINGQTNYTDGFRAFVEGDKHQAYMLGEKLAEIILKKVERQELK